MEENVVNALQDVIALALFCAIVLIWVVGKILSAWFFWRSMRAFEKISDSMAGMVNRAPEEDVPAAAEIEES